MGKVRDNAKRAKCVSNLRQISLCLINIAQQDRLQRFPTSKAGFLPWDVDRDTLISIFGNAAKTIMYCPSGQNITTDQMWEIGGYAATQYILLIPGTGGMGGDNEDLINYKLQELYKVKQNNQTVQVGPSQRELAVDVIALQGRNELYYSSILKNGTNHVSKNKPLGANVAFVDGHVTWRNFADTARHITIAGAQFWW